MELNTHKGRWNSTHIKEDGTQHTSTHKRKMELNTHKGRWNSTHKKEDGTQHT